LTIHAKQVKTIQPIQIQMFSQYRSTIILYKWQLTCYNKDMEQQLKVV